MDYDAKKYQNAGPIEDSSKSLDFDYQNEMKEDLLPRETPNIAPYLREIDYQSPAPNPKPKPYPYPTYPTQTEKCKELKHKLHESFRNPEKIKAILKKSKDNPLLFANIPSKSVETVNFEDLDPVEDIDPNLLGPGPTVHSTLYLEKQLTKQMKVRLDSNQIEGNCEEASKVLNITRDTKIFHELVNIDVATPQKQRMIRKQIDPRWIEEMEIAPDINDVAFEQDLEPMAPLSKPLFCHEVTYQRKTDNNFKQLNTTCNLSPSLLASSQYDIDNRSIIRPVSFYTGTFKQII